MRRVRVSYLLLAAAPALVVSAIWLAVPESAEPQPLPELAKDLPQDWRRADAVFGGRVRDHFPTGMSVQAVIRVLENQGFSISADQTSASFERADIVCRHVWRIFWAGDEAQRIRGISGTYGGICL